MKLAIHQPQYMAWSGYFHKMAGADLFILLDDVQYKKNEWQNRNRIRSSSGWQWLTVPNRYHFPEKICEVPLNHDVPWQHQHLQALQSCYGRAPWFSQFAPAFEAFFQSAFETMAKVATASVTLLAGMLNIATPIDLSSHHPVEGVSTERLVNLCRLLGADTYLAGAGGRNYMDLSLFEAAGIAVEFQSFDPPRYPQLFCKGEEDFIPGLSAIDLIFNCGPKARAVLMEGNRAP